MMALSDFSPWSEYARFTDWFIDYGVPYSIRIKGKDIRQYDRTIEKRVISVVDKYKVSMTRADAGHKHEPVDVLIDIPLNKQQQKFYKQLDVDKVIPKYDILGDTPSKLNNKKHQISGGFVKNEFGEVYTLKNNPKMDWLKANVEDPSDTIILAHHIEEQIALAKEFPNTGSITKLCEGKDFSHFKNMIIYSMSFSAATYEQVRVRQANINRKDPIKLIFLISGIDAHVYKAVKANKNFTASWYKNNA